MTGILYSLNSFMEKGGFLSLQYDQEDQLGPPLCEKTVKADQPNLWSVDHPFFILLCVSELWYLNSMKSLTLYWRRRLEFVAVLICLQYLPEIFIPVFKNVVQWFLELLLRVCLKVRTNLWTKRRMWKPLPKKPAV